MLRVRALKYNGVHFFSFHQAVKLTAQAIIVNVMALKKYKYT